MKSICVYCSSSSAVDPHYVEATVEFGTLLGRRGLTLVYGGASVGLMGQLATAVQTASTAAGAAINVAVGSNGALAIQTTAEGAAATLRVTGGTSLSALNLTTDGAVITGTNGQLTIDGGATQTFGATSPLGTGATIALNAGAGTITAALSGGLRVGSVTANNISTGDGSLGAVVSVTVARSGRVQPVG